MTGTPGGNGCVVRFRRCVKCPHKFQTRESIVGDAPAASFTLSVAEFARNVGLADVLSANNDPVTSITEESNNELC